MLGEMMESRRRLARKLGFFDAGIWLGPPAGFPLARELSPEELPQVLQKRFLAGGLVSHWRGKTVSAQQGNADLLELAGRLDGDLYLTWTALPLDPGGQGPLPGQRQLPEKVRAVRIFPRSHGYPLAEWCLGGLCEKLIAHRLPLFIWHVELDWSSLRALALAFPNLNIVVETQTQKILYHTRPLFALMGQCPNVHLELSNLPGPGFIEYAVGRFGAERLIFGSFLPVSDPLVPMGMVLDADISEADKARLAGGNLRRLVQEVRA